MAIFLNKLIQFYLNNDKYSPFNSKHYIVLYPQNGYRIVTIESMTSLHPAIMYNIHNISPCGFTTVCELDVINVGGAVVYIWAAGMFLRRRSLMLKLMTFTGAVVIFIYLILNRLQYTRHYRQQQQQLSKSSDASDVEQERRNGRTTNHPPQRY